MTNRPAGFEQRVFVALSINDPTAPTEAEIAGAIEITIDLPSPVSFSATTNFMDTSDISSRQDKNQLGNVSLDNLSFEIYRDKENQVAAPALPNETDLYILKFEGGNIANPETGPAAGDICDVATVTVGIKSDVSSPRNDSRRMLVPFAIRDEIAWDATVVDGGS